MQQVALDEQNWAQLKEVSELRRSDRKRVNEAIVFEGDPVTGNPIIRASMDDDIAEAVLKEVVLNWSLPWQVPSVDVRVLDNLTLEQDTNLRKAIQPHIDAIQGKETPVKENAAPTEASAS